MLKIQIENQLIMKRIKEQQSDYRETSLESQQQKRLVKSICRFPYILNKNSMKELNLTQEDVIEREMEGLAKVSNKSMIENSNPDPPTAPKLPHIPNLQSDVNEFITKRTA